MIQVVGSKLSQWDVGRRVSVNCDATHVHFANKGDSEAPIIAITNGEAIIPDYLLRTGKGLLAYAVRDGVTLESKAFAVRNRERPENYIYEDDQRNYIYELVQSVEEATAEAERVAEELRTARDNGEFNGPKGDPGKPGEPGKNAEGSILYTEQALTDEQKAQARANIDACAMKDVVDKLCPSFAESGSVVTCEPVEGYPLEVTAEDGATIYRCGKNMMTNDTVDTASTASNKRLWSGNLKPPYVISGDFSQYTEGNKAGLIQCVFDGGTETPVSVMQMRDGYTNTKTLTQIRYVHWDTGSGIAKLQLEVGSIATAYEPYKTRGTFAIGENVPALPGINTLWADKGNITVTGKADPVAIINKLSNAILSLGSEEE